jgi:hypothetical protein
VPKSAIGKMDARVAKIGKTIIGTTVVAVGVADLGCGEIVPYVRFSNDVVALVMCDSEGNHAGALHLEQEGEAIGVICTE